MKWSVFIIIVGVLFLAGSAQASITRDLKLGDRGDDVRELQQKLNGLGVLVSEFGPGSLGLETNFFGEATKRAVIRYQEQNRDRVLVPAGLTKGTGYVGFLTRLLLITNVALPSTSNQINQSMFVAPPPVSKTEIDTISKKGVIPSSKSEFPALKSPDKISLAGFSLPQPKRSTILKLASLSPSSGGPGTEIVIKGAGFSKRDNTVYTSSEVVKNVSSTDGATIKVTINPPYEVNTLNSEVREKIKRTATIPLWIYVENETGVSNEVIFNLQLNHE